MRQNGDWYRTQRLSNLVSYWENKSTTWKKLSQVAQCILGVPAAITSSERSFSIAGRTVDERRTHLSVDSVDGLLDLYPRTCLNFKVIIDTDS